MAVTQFTYAQSLLSLLNKEWDFNSDVIKCMLTTVSYVPNKDTHAYKSDVTNEVTGTAYVAGGATCGSAAMTYTAAASATAWAVGTAYVVGDTVRKVATNGHVYRCIVAGTSHATTEPTWPTGPGATITDNTVTWAEAGAGFIMMDCNDPTWAASTITARIAVFYDSTPASDATRPLIAYVDFGADVSSNNGTFTVVVSANGVQRIFVN